jgi:hypothetical protein
VLNEAAAKHYAAQVVCLDCIECAQSHVAQLVTLAYFSHLGLVYRDLKPGEIWRHTRVQSDAWRRESVDRRRRVPAVR